MWNFVSVEDKCYAATAVVQMPGVWLALGARFWRGRSGPGTNPPLLARRGETRQVAVLQALLSSWAGLLFRVLGGRRKHAGTATTQHLSQRNGLFIHVVLPCSFLIMATMVNVNWFCPTIRFKKVTFVQSALPLMQWQLLHSSSHWLPWGNCSPA